jgi:hypothetical protein
MRPILKNWMLAFAGEQGMADANSLNLRLS